MSNLIAFKYIVRDRVLLLEECSVVVELKNVIKLGWKTQRIWSDKLRGFTDERMYFIYYNNVEYASYDPDVDSLKGKECGPCGCQIFECEFEFFE